MCECTHRFRKITGSVNAANLTIWEQMPQHITRVFSGISVWKGLRLLGCTKDFCCCFARSAWDPPLWLVRGHTLNTNCIYFVSLSSVCSVGKWQLWNLLKWFITFSLSYCFLGNVIVCAGYVKHCRSIILRGNGKYFLRRPKLPRSNKECFGKR